MGRFDLWPKTYPELAKKAKARIRAHSDQEAPNEACGIIWPDGSITRLRNEAEQPHQEFLISERAISLAKASTGMNPVAIYHTHPGHTARPSRADAELLRDLADRNSLPVMFIYGKDGLRGWTWDDDGCEEVDLELPPQR